MSCVLAAVLSQMPFHITLPSASGTLPMFSFIIVSALPRGDQHLGSISIAQPRSCSEESQD